MEIPDFEERRSSIFSKYILPIILAAPSAYMGVQIALTQLAGELTAVRDTLIILKDNDKESQLDRKEFRERITRLETEMKICLPHVTTPK